MKILIVDDNSDDRKILRYAAIQHGHEVIEAENGFEGLRMARDRKPDFIISDALMPLMDGFKLLMNLKRDESLKSVPFVFYSAVYIEERDVQLGISMGAEAYIIKPKDPVELWQQIEGIIDKRKEGKPDRRENPEITDEYVDKYCERVALMLEKKMTELENSRNLYMTLAADLGEQKLKLMESEERYRSIFEKSPAVMLIIDPDSAEVVDANSAAFQFYGYERNHLIGKKMSEIIVLPEEQIYRRLQDSKKGPLRIQIRQRVASGEIRDVEVFRGPVEIRGKTYLYSITHDITTRRHAEEALRESEHKLRAIADTATDAIILIDNEGLILYWNSAAERMLGYDRMEVMGKNVEMIIPPVFRTGHKKAFGLFAKTGHGPMIGKIYEVSSLRKDGSEFPVELSISGFMLKDKWHSAGVMRDITARKNLEYQLRQSQKMEALGTFAGSIAHDFNNILTAIIGYGNLIQMTTDKNDPVHANIENILAAAERAATLTRSLLAFGRKRPIETKPVEVNDVLRNVQKFLARLLPENITLEYYLTIESSISLIDAAQMELVIINLATNARDAMPKGGAIVITTETIELNNDFIQAYGYGIPGNYILLSVSDTGVGMDEKTRQRIFEPFFTTKEAGKGTGLGLSIVYGIVKQHNGYINCYSELGFGTTFRIYLPLSREMPEKEMKNPEILPTGGHETIFVVEDDEDARKLDRHLLETFGYKIIEAADGEEALSIFMEHKNAIDLVFLDVIMPKMNGREVYEEITKIRPGIKVLFSSGYAADIFPEEEREKFDFISKPAVPTALLKKIREMLDRP